MAGVRRLVDGQRTDARFTDGLQKIYNLLENSTNAALVTKYGLWLVSHDRGLGTKVSPLSLRCWRVSPGQVPRLTVSGNSATSYFVNQRAESSLTRPRVSWHWRVSISRRPTTFSRISSLRTAKLCVVLFFPF